MLKAILSISILIGLLFAPVTVKAYNLFPDVCSGGVKDSSICKDDKKSENPVANIITNVTNVVSFFAAVAAIIAIMFGGFRFVTSNGNPTRAATGRMTVLYAVVGLVIVIVARSLVLFIVTKL